MDITICEVIREKFSERLFDDGNTGVKTTDVQAKIKNLEVLFNSNPFVKKCICYVENFILKSRITYVNGDKFEIFFTTHCPQEYMVNQISETIDKYCKEKGWVKEKLEVNTEPEYNPADDPYYHNEEFYIPNKINFS